MKPLLVASVELVEDGQEHGVGGQTGVGGGDQSGDLLELLLLVLLVQLWKLQLAEEVLDGLHAGLVLVTVVLLKMAGEGEV